MSPTTSGYKELGLDLVEPLKYQPHKPRQPPMVEEKKEEGEGDPIKIFLKESSSNNHTRGATPFKVQVNFDLPIFEDQIDANVIDRWLNLLEGYF